MGVAGSGKSSVAAAVAPLLQWPLLDADRFHPPANVAKMRAGLSLSDRDREPWLEAIGVALRHHHRGAVLSCSALKRDYRDTLRQAAPGLMTVYLKLPRGMALSRVAERGDAHFFPPGLVASQYAALEPPTNEPLVLELDARRPVQALVADIVGWVARG